MDVKLVVPVAVGVMSCVLVIGSWPTRAMRYRALLLAQVAVVVSVWAVVGAAGFWAIAPGQAEAALAQWRVNPITMAFASASRELLLLAIAAAGVVASQMAQALLDFARRVNGGTK